MTNTRVPTLFAYVILYFVTSLKEVVMSVLRPSLDVLPVTEFRANTSAFLAQLRSNKRPIILTQHGRSAAVVLDVEEYERLLDEITLLREIRVAEDQVARGEGLSHDQVARELRSRLVT